MPARALPRPLAANPAGLTSTEALERAQRGLANRVAQRERTNRQITLDNLVTFFNLVLGSLILVLLVLAAVDRSMSLLQDGLFVGLVAVANTAISTFQEIRATNTLGRLVAQTAPHAEVIRDGLEQRLPAEQVVQGDLIHLRPGDRVVADGRIADGQAEVDESAITGESTPVLKLSAGQLLSGSFCTAGGCHYTADHVGSDAYAVRVAADARTLVHRPTPLQLRFNRILRVLLTATLTLGALLLISYNVQHRGFAESIKAATATMTTVVPEGLLLSMTVAFAIGAVRVSRRGAIVQDIAAVEALNYVDVVCMDKTGTITANRLTVRAVRWLAEGDEQAGWLGAFAAATAGDSRTAAALAAALAGSTNGAVECGGVPFSSERRWSGRWLELDGRRRAFVMGAPETLLPFMPDAARLQPLYDAATAQGLRAVLIAEARELPSQDGALGTLAPVALITLADVLRPEVGRAFETMERLGVEPRIVSGDSPGTVAALVSQLGIALKGGVIAGEELEQLEGAEFARAIEANSIFGRVRPQLKARIVTGLQEAGHFVAMVGDGANDVQALRQADVAVSMASGTEIARAVAGIVLLEDSFAAFVAATGEAQAVLGNCARLSKLFLAKSLYAFLIIVATSMLGLNFPFLPRHGSLTALLTLGIPAVFISASVPPPGAGRDFTRNVLRFALPAAFALAGVAILVHLLTDGLFGRPVAESRTLVSVTLGIAGLCFMLQVLGLEGASLHNITRPLLSLVLSGLLLAGLVLTLETAWLRRFFDFTPMGAGQWTVVGVAVVLALSGRYLLSHYWQNVVDFATARPTGEAVPRGRTL
jgi:cation-transporting P-type ATPase E